MAVLWNKRYAALVRRFRGLSQALQHELKEALSFQCAAVAAHRDWLLSFHVRNCCISVVAHALQRHYS
jgi:hypothetical protein